MADPYILLVEDELHIAQGLKFNLEMEGFLVEHVTTGEQALAKKPWAGCCLVILDLMLPGIDGLQVCRIIRQENDQLPILMLTAMSKEEDRVAGLAEGADDYLTKPFNMEELLARMEAILRRSKTEEKNSPEGDVYKLGKMEFNFVRQILSMGGEENKLTSKEAALLKLLCQNLNEVVDRSVALNKIWLDDSYFNARSMDVYITKLRKYLKQDPTVELLNVHGVGFKLITR